MSHTRVGVDLLHRRCRESSPTQTRLGFRLIGPGIAYKRSLTLRAHPPAGHNTKEYREGDVLVVPRAPDVPRVSRSSVRCAHCGELVGEYHAICIIEGEERRWS